MFLASPHCLLSKELCLACLTRLTWLSKRSQRFGRAFRLCRDCRRAQSLSDPADPVPQNANSFCLLKHKSRAPIRLRIVGIGDSPRGQESSEARIVRPQVSVVSPADDRI